MFVIHCRIFDVKYSLSNQPLNISIVTVITYVLVIQAEPETCGNRY
jgi:hypothetical protein